MVAPARELLLPTRYPIVSSVFLPNKICFQQGHVVDNLSHARKWLAGVLSAATGSHGLTSLDAIYRSNALLYNRLTSDISHTAVSCFDMGLPYNLHQNGRMTKRSNIETPT